MQRNGAAIVSRIAVARNGGACSPITLFVTTTLPTHSMDSNSKAKPPVPSADRLGNSGPLEEIAGRRRGYRPGMSLTMPVRSSMLPFQSV